MLKRLCAALLTLAISMGLVTAFSGTASATNYQVIAPTGGPLLLSAAPACGDRHTRR
ncbi:hypothetical protein ACIRYZ_23940 [Kitasatospora sp. NPDC101155]|uniref:hypothetical protein n=1 Tax=Kitasatospora sp. NPDC101155 TaxID=3364097 RepID=UPI0037F6956A